MNNRCQSVCRWNDGAKKPYERQCCLQSEHKGVHLSTPESRNSNWFCRAWAPLIHKIPSNPNYGVFNCSHTYLGRYGEFYHDDAYLYEAMERLAYEKLYI
jgi:hypothetical protein